MGAGIGVNDKWAVWRLHRTEKAHDSPTDGQKIAQVCNSLMIVVYSVPRREQVARQTSLYPYSTWSLTCVWQTLGLTPVLYVPFSFSFSFFYFYFFADTRFQGYGYEFPSVLEYGPIPGNISYCVPPSVVIFPSLLSPSTFTDLFWLPRSFQ